MRIYLSGTANLGDFMNSMPVLSGINKKYGKIDFIIKDGMKKFKGIKDFLMFQDLFSSVSFDDEIFVYGDVIQLSSWPMRMDRTAPFRPLETCRYENWLKDHYKIDIDIDDDFELKVPELNLNVSSDYYCGDRWDGPEIDIANGRKTNTLSAIPNVKFLDYNNDVTTNAYIVKNCKGPFISGFTGISIVADLMNKDSLILWTDDIQNFDNKPIAFSYEKHFYGNRKTKLMYYGDFSSENLK